MTRVPMQTVLCLVIVVAWTAVLATPAFSSHSADTTGNTPLQHTTRKASLPLPRKRQRQRRATPTCGCDHGCDAGCDTGSLGCDVSCDSSCALLPPSHPFAVPDNSCPVLAITKLTASSMADYSSG